MGSLREVTRAAERRAQRPRAHAASYPGVVAGPARTSSAPSEDRYAWTEPGAHVAAPGLYRIPCPLPHDGLRAVNVYAIEQGSGFALIDSGWRHPATMEALEAGLRALGAGLSDVTTVICTHSHYDHYGLAAHVRDVAGSPVVLGRIESRSLDVAIDRDAHRRWLTERNAYLRDHGAEALVELMIARESEAFDSIRARLGSFGVPDRLLDDGDRVELDDRVLTAYVTPGHTRGHLVFLDESSGVLFAGDHVLPHITPSLGFEPFMDGKALERFLGGLARVRDLPASIVLPGHGPVFTDLPGRVDELQRHHEQRLAHCLAIVTDSGGNLSSAAVASELPWTRHLRAFADLDVFNQMLAVIETATHLELLADRGDLDRTVDPAVRYSRPG
jgi:glyoxylase-like metal-dependent hydrolase (beta-lactamase superfamily II)